MSWRAPNDFELTLLADTRKRWREVIPLAQCLSLAPRIEPLLLRNARLRFAPQAEPQVESLLWFSPLVAARSTREIVLHLGVAHALAEEWQQDHADELQILWAFTRRHTRHWSAEDRLERDLRYYSLLGDRERLKLGLRDILRRVHAEPDPGRKVALSRLVKRSLPVIGPAGRGLEEARLLAQYAALTLGDGGGWTQLDKGPGQPQALPAWLAAKLPDPVGAARLGVEIRHDARHGQVLHLVKPEGEGAAIDFPSPLPAWLFVAGEGRAGAWHQVTRGSRIRIEPPSPSLRLTTLDGRQWHLSTDGLPSGPQKPGTTSAPLLLSHVPEDREQAERIARWLRDKGLDVELLVETARAPGSATRPARVVRLWTRAAQVFWDRSPPEATEVAAEGLLLRIEEAGLPSAGVGRAQVLDWQDWSRLDGSPRAKRLLEQLQRWRDGAEIERDIPHEPALAPKHDEEVDKLLAEIDDPKTEPPRRLEIGDRLAELGDTRRGVGVIEIQVPMDEQVESAEPPATEKRPGYAPEVQHLLDEIADPATEPPRRLEIGDELERLGDPRLGVGLTTDGLPDIDWVEIPGGPFIYQDGETRELPTFRIARYPVTNRQFQAFIDAGGYGQGPLKKSRARKILDKLVGQDPVWWEGLKKPDPKESSWPRGNRPRTDVDWYEAVAFARWLNSSLGLPDGSIRLPTEVEWEKAARGERGLIYPWGNEYHSGLANLDEKGGEVGPWYLEQTTAVGLYPQGRSPYGVEDLAGTVWEWCLNEYDKPESQEVDSSDGARVLRGGSWITHSGYARAVYRFRNHPGHRNYNWGFRLLSSVPIPGA